MLMLSSFLVVKYLVCTTFFHGDKYCNRLPEGMFILLSFSVF
jgi:hypothetical protein